MINVKTCPGVFCQQMVDVCLKTSALLHSDKINFQILGTHPLFKENQGEWWKHLPSLSTMSFSLAQDHVSSRAWCRNSQAAWRSNEGWDGYYWWYWWLLITQFMFTSTKPFFPSFICCLYCRGVSVSREMLHSMSAITLEKPVCIISSFLQ